MTKQEKGVSAAYWTIATIGIICVYVQRDVTAKRDALGALVFAAVLYGLAVLIQWYRNKKGIK